MNTQNGAIFDMDGLMYDTERIARDAWLYTANEMGFELTKKQCDSFRGTNKAYKKDLFCKWYGTDFNYEQAFSIRQQYIENYLHENGVPVKKGLYKLMDALKAKNYKIAVATSTQRATAKKYWEETKIDSYLDTNICGNEVTKSKPDPEIFLKAANKLSVPISQCLIFEDSFHGVEAAYAAGGIVVMIPDLTQPTDVIRKKCNYIFKDLEESIAIL